MTTLQRETESLTYVMLYSYHQDWFLIENITKFVFNHQVKKGGENSLSARE